MDESKFFSAKFTKLTILNSELKRKEPGYHVDSLTKMRSVSIELGMMVYACRTCTCAVRLCVLVEFE